MAITDFEHIVIGGQQRSGTSMVRALVGSHPKIAIYELDLTFWPRFSEVYADRKLSQKEKEELIRSVVSHEKVTKAHIGFKWEEFRDFAASYQQPEEEFFYAFYVRFLELYRAKREREIVGLKTPFNEFYFSKIIRVFPKTKFIHVVRNPLDVAVSLKEAKKRWWGGKIDYHSHIRLWKKSAQMAIENLERYPARYFVIKYEDIVFQPEESVKNMCAFLEVDFEPDMLQMNNHLGWDGTNSSFGRETGASTFRKDAINRYKKKMDPKIRDEYYYFLKKYLEYFGYDQEDVSIGGVTKLDYALTDVKEAAKEKLIYRIRRSPLYPVLKKHFS